jgi:hypothetical protein
VRRLLVLVVLLLTVPARADDPVLDPTTRAELVAVLKDATAVQKVCYGYELDVNDQSGSGSGGTWRASNVGDGLPAGAGLGCDEVVVLRAEITYTSDGSEQEDYASWSVDSSFGVITADDLSKLGLNADQLLNDGKAETTLYNAVLALPVLVADSGHAPPIVLDPSAEPVPSDARSTGRPGSDWWRENIATVCVLVGLLIVAVLWAGATTDSGFRRTRAMWRAVKKA